MKIVYLLAGEILAPAARAQAFPLLAALRARGHETEIVVAASLRRWIRPGLYAGPLAEARAAAGRVRVVPHPPGHRIPGLTARLVLRAARKARPDVVHARQARAAALAVRAGLAPLVADLRGIRPEEFVLAAGRPEAALSRAERRTLGALRAEERAAVERAGALVCVSQAFRRRLGGGDRVFAIPNAAARVPDLDAGERRALRERFGIGPGDTAFVYSGSLAAWQCVGETVRLFRELRGVVPSAKLTLLVHDRAEGERLLASENVPGCAESLGPREAALALRAFDVGFLLRRRDPVNEVSCPVKFAEYLHAGLGVVLTEGIGDASEWTRAHSLGIVLPDHGSAENAARVAEGLPHLLAGRCRSFAREHLTFERTAARYEEAYAYARGAAR